MKNVRITELFRKPVREERKLLIILTRGKGQPFFKRPFKIAGCHAASKARLMSKKANHVTRFLFLLFSMRDISELQAVSVDFAGLNPCWLGLNQEKSLASTLSLL